MLRRYVSIKGIGHEWRTDASEQHLLVHAHIGMVDHMNLSCIPFVMKDPLQMVVVP